MANQYTNSQMVQLLSERTGLSTAKIARIPEGKLRDVFNYVESSLEECQKTHMGYKSAAVTIAIGVAFEVAARTVLDEDYARMMSHAVAGVIGGAFSLMFVGNNWFFNNDAEASSRKVREYVVTEAGLPASEVKELRIS